MRLYLLRHGKTEAFAEADKVRNLLPKGNAQSKFIGEYFAANEVQFDHIFCSDSHRTIQTLEIVRENCSLNIVPELSPLLYLANSIDYLRFITQNSKENAFNILLVGHNNGISAMATFLTEHEVNLRTGEMIILDLNKTKLNESFEGCARILEMHRAVI